MSIQKSKFKTSTIITIICLIVSILISNVLLFVGDMVFLNSSKKNIAYAEGVIDSIGTLTSTNGVNIKIGVGDYNTVALTADGTAWAWGYNEYGQLGDGTTIDRSTPVQVNLSGLPDGVTVSDVALGCNYGVALMSNGTVWAWGYNESGQLGDGTTLDSSIPVQVKDLTDVIAISAGGYHTLALKKDGTVWTWGYNEYGQLGDGTTLDSSIPVQVKDLIDVIAISAGDYHTVALMNNGTVYSWGLNWYEQLGDGTTTNRSTPVQVKELTDVIAITASSLHTVALKRVGTVWAWGYNESGQLGDGTTTNRSTPVQAKDLTDVIAISAGGHHTIALMNNGTVYSWGYNGYGQLGDGTTTNRLEPDRVLGLNNIIAIASGFCHSVVLEEGGRIWTFGWNFAGQLGDNSEEDRYKPVIAYFPPSEAIACVSKANPEVEETISATLTVKNSLGTTATEFNGKYDVTISDVKASPKGLYGSFNGEKLTGASQTVPVEFADGQATVSLKLDSAGIQNINFSIADLKIPSTNTITLNVAPPTGSIEINNRATYTNNPSVILALNAVGATEMMISEDMSFAGESYEPYVTIASFILSNGDGAKIIYAKFKDAAGNESGVVSGLITLSITQPIVTTTSKAGNATNKNPISRTIPLNKEAIEFLPKGSITINGGAKHTNNLRVKLALNAIGATEMIVSENEGFAGASYVAYAETAEFTLSKGDGLKTIYVKFKDAVGNESKIANATITLDTKVPNVSPTSKINSIMKNVLIIISVCLLCISIPIFVRYFRGSKKQ